MENFRFEVWMGINALFLLLSVNVTAQPGFLSIDCGAKTNHTARNNIRWVTDHDYIHVGQKAYTGDTSEEAFGSYMQYLRYFPKPLVKSSYQLPVVPNVPFLLRLWFAIGNYSGFSAVPNFAYSIETQDILTVRNVSLEDDLRRGEKILVTAGRVLYLCLIKTSENDDPFINAIELRTLRDGMYPQAKPGTLLSLSSRYDVGGNMSVRYPLDQFDRLWNSDVDLMASINPDFRQYIHYVNSEEPISTNNTQDLPPSVVMQTALVMASNASLVLSLNGTGGSNSLLLLYFAEIEPLNMSETRSFNLSINDRQYAEPITLVPNYSASELPLQLNMTQNLLALQRNFNPNYGPIINAFEYYVMVDTEPATYLELSSIT